MKLNELGELEKLCEVNIQVYSRTLKVKKKKLDPTLPQYFSDAHIATTKALYSSTSTRTIFLTLKISLGISNLFDVHHVASTGKVPIS